MAHPLETKIAQVRSHARRLLLLYSLGWTLACLLLAVLLLGLADYLIRLHDPGVRLMFSLVLLLVGGWCLYRFWISGMSRRLGDVELARSVERRFPLLTDRLSSAVVFLKQSDADVHAGSATLRQAVIADAAGESEPLNFLEALERRPMHRALAALAGVALIGAGVAIVAPLSTRIALARLARPWGDDAWPRLHSVEFNEPPSRLAVGQNFEVELLADAGHRVPDDVRIFYRYEMGPDGEEIESEPMRMLNGAMVARKDNVTRPFWYRAEGGDDQTMPWRRLEVIEPPRVESVEITLEPPAYTGLPREMSDTSIHALRGTRVGISGTSTKKLHSAKLHLENGDDLDAEISADAFGFSLALDAPQPFVIDKSGTYSIELEDTEEMTGGTQDRHEIHAIADQPPTVTVDEPAGNIFVTAEGEVPLVITAKDDLGIHEIALVYNRSDRSDVEEFVVPLKTGPAQITARTEAGLLLGSQLQEKQSIEHRWSLAELGARPGVQITFWGTASDYLPQSGKSAVRRLSIISPQDLEERLAQRQKLIFGELQRVLKLEQDARSQTESLEVQMQKVGHLAKEDIDHAQAAELNQRQVTRTLSSRTEGIPVQIADFLDDLRNNRVDNPEMQRQMSSILDELNRLGQDHLGTVERELTSVIKAAQAEVARNNSENDFTAKTKPDPRIEKALSAVGENQDQVIASLEQMLGDLRQWDSYRRFAREIAQLGHDQEEIAKNTKEIGQQTLGRDLKELEPQQQANLKKLAGQQAELGRRLEKVQQQMAQMRDSLQPSDPLSAATIGDGLHHAQQSAISGQMRKSSDQVEKNQLGQAVEQQAKIGKELEELVSILSNRREQELSRLVKQLRQAEQELSQLRQEQAGLGKKIRDTLAQKNPITSPPTLERLLREHKQLQEEAERLARRLERLQADRAGRSTSNAADKMSQAGNADQQGDAAGGDNQEQQAEKDLEDAQRQLAERRRQAEEDLSREQLARLEDGLKSLQQRQKKLIDETQRLETARADGRLTRSQASTVNDLARQQKALEGETTQLAEKLSLAEVINLALEGAAKKMTLATDLLGKRDTGSQTQGAQEAARTRFAQLLSAFENKSKPGEPQQDSGAGEGGGSSSQPGGIASLTELKLLKVLQEDLNGRYRSIVAERDQGTAADATELSELAAEQGKLADLALKLAKPPEAAPEDDPEKLPDIRKSPADDVPPPEPLELERS